MSPQLRILAALPEDCVQFLAPRSGGSQVPITSAPRDPTSLACIGTCTRRAHTHGKTLTSTHNFKK